MDHFDYHNQTLFADKVSIPAIVEAVGTPCFIYSKATIERHFKIFDSAFTTLPHLSCYAVKANSNLALLKILVNMGSGFDIVSEGELERVLHVGAKGNTIIFSGVGKTEREITLALQKQILCFNVESEPELNRIESIAKQQKLIAPIALRVNPNVDAKSHPYISTGLKENKFGISESEAIELYKRISESEYLSAIGIACHIGSQITELSPYLEACDKLKDLVCELEDIGIDLDHIDVGGGLGVTYTNETPPTPAQWAKAIELKLTELGKKIIIEPGRAIAANAGILVSRIEYIKKTPNKQFAIIDAGMNDFLRPALYQAEHPVIPILKKDIPPTKVDVVGPVCESADCFAKEISLAIEPMDLLAIRGAGAYGFCMASNYNSRLLGAEVMVDGKTFTEVRKRQTLNRLLEDEIIL